MFNPSYIFREGLEPSWFHIFPSDEKNSELIHARCAASDKEREFPVYVDEVERSQEDIYCGRCDQLILAGN